MSSNHLELHPERLHTTDEHGNRVYVHPEDLKGPWKNRRKIFYAFLVLVYMVVPWIYVDGQQWILLDLPNREFKFGSILFYAHEVPYLFFFLAAFIFFFAFVTSVWGRVWCGWGCPQTVFLDLIYRPIEKMIEGGSRRRMKLDQAPMSLSKLLKKITKWFLFTLVSLHISHSLLGYFVGTHELLNISLHSPMEHFELFLTMLFVTGVFLFDFGWFREQFCIIMCPYGRIQSVFMDPSSLIVGYDFNRGEPRKGQPSKDHGDHGDCVNCFQCVKVCPTGIDIRRGTQLECIACTACIDACDNIMERLKKPKGLIRYTSEDELNGKKSRSFLKPRSFVYMAIIIAIFSAGSYSISHKNDLRVVFLRGSKTPYQVSKVGSEELIVNHYEADFYYQLDETLHLKIRLDEDAQKKGVHFVTPSYPIKVSKTKKKTAHVFFKFPATALKKGKLLLKVYFMQKEKVIATKEVPLVGPY